MFNFKAATAMTLSLVVTGCASIVSDSHYPVQVNTAPTGIPFEVLNKNNQTVMSGVSPSNVNLKSGAGYFSGETYKFIFKSACDETREQILDSSVDGWYAGNIIFGGLIGLFIVDPLTGAMFKLPQNVNQNMTNLCLAQEEASSKDESL